MPAAAATLGASLEFCTICVILYACFSSKRTIPNIYSSAKLSFHHFLHISFVPLHKKYIYHYILPYFTKKINCNCS